MLILKNILGFNLSWCQDFLRMASGAHTLEMSLSFSEKMAVLLQLTNQQQALFLFESYTNIQINMQYVVFSNCRTLDFLCRAATSEEICWWKYKYMLMFISWSGYIIWRVLLECILLIIFKFEFCKVYFFVSFPQANPCVFSLVSL